MKYLILIISSLVFANSNAQQIERLGEDCNPTLNKKEINYLNSMFEKDKFEFSNKSIGFASYKVKKICKTETFELSQFLPITKKEFFTNSLRDNCNSTISNLFILNDEQKKISKGFDAIVLIAPKKKQKKINTKIREEITETLGYRTLNYPDNLSQVGNDSIPELTQQDAIFFNQIYGYKKGSFDFNGKKVAFINPHLEKNEAIRTKKDFIGKIKAHLDSDFLYPASEELLVLSEEEKKQTNGYDAIIVYQTKRSYREQLINLLKEKRIAP